MILKEKLRGKNAMQLLSKEVIFQDLNMLLQVGLLDQSRTSTIKSLLKSQTPMNPRDQIKFSKIWSRVSPIKYQSSRFFSLETELMAASYDNQQSHYGCYSHKGFEKDRGMMLCGIERLILFTFYTLLYKDPGEK